MYFARKVIARASGEILPVIVGIILWCFAVLIMLVAQVTAIRDVRSGYALNVVSAILFVIGLIFMNSKWNWLNKIFHPVASRSKNVNYIFLGFVLWCIAIILGYVAQYFLKINLVGGGYTAYGIASVFAIAGFFIINRYLPINKVEVRYAKSTFVRGYKKVICLFLLFVGLLSVGVSIYFLEINKSILTLLFWLVGLFIFVCGIWFFESDRRSFKINWKSWELLLICMLLVLAFGLRSFDLSQIPQTFNPDEAMIGLDARQLLNGQNWNIFSVGAFDHPRLGYAVDSIFMYFFGDNIYGIRMSSVILGTLSVLLLYLTAKALFSIRVAFLSAFLMTVSQWHIHFSRMGIDSIHTAVVGLLLFYFFLRSLQTQSFLMFLLSGFAGALCLYVYMPARLILVLLAFFILHKTFLEKGFLKRNWKGFSIMLIGFVLFVAPMGAFFIQHPDSFFTHGERFIFHPKTKEWVFNALHVNNTSDMLEIHFKRSFQAFNLFGERSTHYGPNGPLLDFWTSPLFILGLSVVTFFILDSSFFLLSEWFWLTLILFNVLTLDPMFSPRTIAMIPWIFILPALVVDTGWRAASTVFNRTGKYFFGIAVVLFILLTAHANYVDYFQTYMQSHPSDSATSISLYMLSINDRYQIYDIGETGTSLHFETQRFMLPNIDGIDVGQKNLELPLKTIPKNKGVAFLVQQGTPYSDERLASLKHAYPDGKMKLETNTNNQPVFYSYLVEQEQLLEAKPNSSVYEG